MTSLLRRRARAAVLALALALGTATAGLILHGPTPNNTIGNYQIGTARA